MDIKYKEIVNLAKATEKFNEILFAISDYNNPH